MEGGYILIPFDSEMILPEDLRQTYGDLLKYVFWGSTLAVDLARIVEQLGADDRIPIEQVMVIVEDAIHYSARRFPLTQRLLNGHTYWDLTIIIESLVDYWARELSNIPRALTLVQLFFVPGGMGLRFAEGDTKEACDEHSYCSKTNSSLGGFARRKGTTIIDTSDGTWPR